MAMRMLPRVPLLFAGAGVVVATLSGCTPAGQIWASLTESGVVRIAFCEAIDAVSVTVRVQGAETEGWSLTGQHTFGFGDIVEYGQAIDGLTLDSGPDQIGDGDVLLVSVKSSEQRQGGGESQRGYFSYDSLTASTWVDSSGRVESEPCS